MSSSSEMPIRPSTERTISTSRTRATRARPSSGRFDLSGASEPRALARGAVRKSLVLMKNDGQILPLKANARILVAGDGADDIARQSGGWALT